MATFQFPCNSGVKVGWLARWLSPGDYLAVSLSMAGTVGTAKLDKRQADGTLTNVASGSAVTLRAGTWYDAKVVIDDDPNDPNTPNGQRLRFWVDGNQNGFDAGDLLLTTTAVDDVWPAGYAGLYTSGR